MTTTDDIIIEIANNLSNADLARLLNLVSDRLCVWVAGPTERNTVCQVIGASLNGACVQIEAD